MLPSPVFCRQPASAAPRFSAVTALPDSAPKLIPEMLTTDSGRKAWRLRVPPSTLAQGSRTSSPACAAVGGAVGPNVRCLTIT